VRTVLSVLFIIILYFFGAVMSVRIWISFFTFAVNLLFNLVVASSWVHPSVLVRSVLLIVLVFCVVLLCVFAFWVPCCDVHYDFAWKRCSIRLYLQLFVGELMSYLRYSCLIAYSDVQHTICCDFALFFFVLCTLCCQFLWIFPFLIAPAVISNVYLNIDSKY
jgi:hypothetical protein